MDGNWSILPVHHTLLGIEPILWMMETGSQIWYGMRFNQKTPCLNKQKVIELGNGESFIKTCD